MQLALPVQRARRVIPAPRERRVRRVQLGRPVIPVPLELLARQGPPARRGPPERPAQPARPAPRSSTGDTGATGATGSLAEVIRVYRRHWCHRIDGCYWSHRSDGCNGLDGSDRFDRRHGLYWAMRARRVIPAPRERWVRLVQLALPVQRARRVMMPAPGRRVQLALPGATGRPGQLGRPVIPVPQVIPVRPGATGHHRKRPARRCHGSLLAQRGHRFDGGHPVPQVRPVQLRLYRCGEMTGQLVDR